MRRPLARWLRWLAVVTIAALGACGSDDSSKSGTGGSSGAGATAGDAGTDGAVCGDGVLGGNEECDNGPTNAPGSGCEPDCTTSCHAATECDDAEPCNGQEACSDVASGRVCSPGTAPAEGSVCGQGGYCEAGVCTKAVCGNGQTEPGEGCEPPGGPTCSDECQVMVCGDGVRVGSEQCDDGNTKNLDGCDATCRYETVMRFTLFEIRTEPSPSFCVHPKNAVGGAMANEVAQALSVSFLAALDGGSFNLMLAPFGGLDDLTGTNSGELSLGMIAGERDPKDPQPWSASNVDSWFLADSDQVDAFGAPKQILAGASITSRILQAGPSFISTRAVSGTTLNEFDLADTKIRARIDDSPPPNVPAPPPAALAPGLAVFQSFTGDESELGLCGALTVGSFANVVLPQEFSLGPNACQPASVCSGSRTYTYCGPGQPVGPSCNSMLDLVVGGCKITALCVSAVKPTQPDVGSGGNPPAPLTFAADGKVYPTVPTDGYSFYLHFNGRRAHLTNNLQ